MRINRRLRSRSRRVRGISANLKIETLISRIFADYGQRVAQDLWDSLQGYLKSRLPSSTFDAIDDPPIDKKSITGDPVLKTEITGRPLSRAARRSVPGTQASIQDSYAEAFDRFTDLEDLKWRASKLYEKNNRESRLKFIRLLNDNLGVSFNDVTTTEVERQIAREGISNTVDKIITINSDYFDEFKQTMESAILENTPLETLRAKVLDATKNEIYYPKWLVDRVVVDQFLTAHALIQQNRQQSAGITHYFWRTSEDARVRDEHAPLNGKRFAWNNPPSEGHPGYAIRCRCIADPDLQSSLLSTLSSL